MGDSLARRAYLPPRRAAVWSDERIRVLASARIIGLALAAFGNISVFAMLSGAHGVRHGLIGPCAAINVSLILADIALTTLFLRRRRPGWTAIFRVCLLMEAAAGILWLQLTGTVSSYYIGAGLLLIILYRLTADYASALVFAGATFLAHYAIFFLEEAGVLHPASLFVAEPSGIYADPTFRWAAMASMSWLYTLAFAAGNVAASVLSEKEVAVDDAQREARRAAEEARPGRLAGRRLAGRWDVGEVLGRGGMGEVYVGHDATTGKTVAIKVLTADMARSRQMRERFRREAALLARIPAAHVPAIQDVTIDDEDGIELIVMDLVRGEDLGAYLRRRRSLPPADVAVLLARIAAALDACHDAGVIHRDLKPPNVMLVDGRLDDVRLLDFGVARLLEPDPEDRPLTRALAVIGTAGYLAPEQVRPAFGAIGPHTDVFALGSIAYRALTGVAAFPSKDAAGAIDDAQHHHPPPPTSISPDLPPDVDAVLALALAKPAALRYARAGELAADFAAALAGTLPAAVRERAARVPGRRATPVAFDPTLPGSTAGDGEA